MSGPTGNNRKTAVVLFAIVGGMVGLAYASVPLYQLFCQITGYGGTTIIAGSRPAETVVPVDAPMITVRFDANVDGALPWSFRPDQKLIKVRVGMESLATYSATNSGQRPIIGNATFNVTPYKAGQYFQKIDCFCFSEQRLNPNQSVSMPVSFFVDPEIFSDPNTREIRTITLSYTFYRAPADKKLQALSNEKVGTSLTKKDSKTQI